MLLSLALLLLGSSVAMISADLTDGDPGVCHFMRKVPFAELEERQRHETRTEWCWDITQMFQCDVVYSYTETVPVTNERDVDTLVCCEGWIQMGDECVYHTEAERDTEEPEYVELKPHQKQDEIHPEAERDTMEPEYVEANANRVVEEEHADIETVSAEPEHVELQPRQAQDEDNVEAENRTSVPEYAEQPASLPEETTVAATDEETTNETSASPPSTVAPAIENRVDAQGSANGHNAEPLGHDVLGILAKELIKSFIKNSSSAANEASTEPAAVIDTKVQDAPTNDLDDSADAARAFAHELLKSLEPSTEAPVESSSDSDRAATEDKQKAKTADALSIFWQELQKSLEYSTEAPAAQPSNSEPSSNGANAEAMTADALSIFMHELLKSLEHSTAPSIDAEPVEDVNTLDHHPSFEADEPVAVVTEAAEEALWRAQAVLVQTMEEIHETLLHCLSLLHRTLSSLHPLAPRRVSLE